MCFLLFIEHSAIEVDTYFIYLLCKLFSFSNGDWLFNHTHSFIGLACATETIQNTKKRMRATIIRAGYQNTVWLIISRRFWAIFWRTFIVYELEKLWCLLVSRSFWHWNRLMVFVLCHEARVQSSAVHSVALGMGKRMPKGIPSPSAQCWGCRPDFSRLHHPHLYHAKAWACH